MEKIIYLKGIGNIAIKKKKNCKSLNLRVKSSEKIYVSMPYNLPFSYAIGFAEKNEKWIKNKIEKCKTIENNNLITDEKDFFTKYHKIRFIRTETEGVKTFIKDDKGIIQINSDIDIKENQIQETIKKFITEIYRKEAKQYIPDVVCAFAEKLRLPVKSIKFKNTKTRWGSCSYDNNINLNIHIAALPDTLRDYIILHELSHTKHKNHSHEFWRFLNLICPDSKILRAELKKYSPEIIKSYRQ